MSFAASYAQLRSFIQHCKRSQLDALIKFTNLPRGGLKPDLQLRLLSYLDEAPNPVFISALNDLIRRTQNVETPTVLPAVPLDATHPHIELHRPTYTSDVSAALPDSTTDSPMYLASLASGEFQQHLRETSSRSETLKRVGDEPDILPIDSWTATRVNSSAPSTTNHNNPQIHNVCPVAVPDCANSSTTGSTPPTKDHSYVVPNPPPAPLITLAGIDGCFRLPAILHGFRFQESPFFKEIDVLYPPQVITPTHIGFATGRRSYDRSLCLRFTADQAETITYHCRRTAADRMEFGIQVIMRFARLDPIFCEQLSKAYGLFAGQESSVAPPIQMSEDSLPVHLAIQVNGHPVQLPSLLPSNRPGMDGRRNPRPVNITQFLRVSPAMPNYIKLTWTHDYSSFVYSLVGVYLMHKRSPQQLCCLLKSKAFQNAETMKLELIRKLSPNSKESLQTPKTQLSSENAIRDAVDDDDDLVMPNTLPVQLLCPLSKCRIEVPVRGRHCSHVQCYDATTYLIINERKPSWNCPVCDKKVYYEDLMIDGLFLEVLNSKCTQDMDEVVFHEDGSWSVSENSSRVPKSSYPEDIRSSESQRTGCGNSPLGMLPTPNSVVSTLEPDSVGSCSTTTLGVSFTASSPAGSATSSTHGGASGSPGRSNNANLMRMSPLKTDNIPSMEKKHTVQHSDTGPIIDLTCSDDEDTEPPVVSFSASHSTTSITISDEDSSLIGSPRPQPQIVNSCSAVPEYPMASFSAQPQTNSTNRSTVLAQPGPRSTTMYRPKTISNTVLSKHGQLNSRPSPVNAVASASDVPLHVPQPFATGEASLHSRKRSNPSENPTPNKFANQSLRSRQTCNPSPQIPRSHPNISGGYPAKLTRSDHHTRETQAPLSYGPVTQNSRFNHQFGSLADTCSSTVYNRKPTHASIPPYDLADYDLPRVRGVATNDHFGMRHDCPTTGPWSEDRMINPMDVVSASSSCMHSCYSSTTSDLLLYPPRLHSQFDTRPSYLDDQRRLPYDDSHYNHMPKLTMGEQPFWSHTRDSLK
ncbi:E3 SUMO-protein ligase pias1 [Clonorchis sinensis]|uniref:E3 SUMO-protein ligase pias1 n=1 Tax=Clonorchis sinensis TaxID=79923 RepID=A0A8T1MXV0_CLOSI|nr:E3 SUMO-protein ligase pias1 [Clonorchis sinensis]